MKMYRVKRLISVEREVQANSEKEAFEMTGGMIEKGKNVPGMYVVEELIDYEVNEVTNGQD